MSAVKLGVLALIVCCFGAAHAAATPGYNATLKFNSRNGSTLTIQGKGTFTSKDGKIVGLIALLGLQTTDSNKADVTTPIAISVFTSNANVDSTGKATGSFGPPTGKAVTQLVLTTNANGFTLSYKVKVDKKGTISIQSDNKVNKNISIKASSTTSKDQFKFTINDSSTPAISETAVSGLPTVTQGKNSIPALGDKKARVGVSNFTLLLGKPTLASLFGASFDKSGKMIGGATGQ